MLMIRFVISVSAFFILASTALAGVSGDGLWTETEDSPFASRTSERLVMPSHYRSFRLDVEAMKARLKSAPAEFSGSSPMNGLILSLPMPDGTFQKFLVEHSPIVEPGLAEKYPELNETYRGQGIDDPTATLRLDFLPMGFHAMVLSPKGTVLIDPYFKRGDLENYVVYDKHDVARSGDFVCHFSEQEPLDQVLSAERLLTERLPFGSLDNVISGTQLRTYRLAVAATFEYSAAVASGMPNTIATALAAQTLIMNRVNGVYERDVAIRMVTVANNNLIVYAPDQTCTGVPCTAANDPYTNTDGIALLSENQNNLDAVIGSSNYDIGHVFSTGGGGVATLNGPCGASKARGVTGLPNPVGDPFAIDYVAHEMGHQWGANHTFNSTTSSCSGNRSGTSAYEPGSGVTIMAYAGICGNQNLERNSIDTFHVKSLEVIVAYSQTGNGNTCAATTATGNTPPTVSVVGGPSFNIPKLTPFALTAAGSDPNNDSLTYDWQEYTLGASTTTVPNTDATGARPILRPYLPTSSPTRTFPSLAYILNNANVPPNTKPCGTASTCLTGELLPQIGGRTLTFQVVARDNRASGGGINSATASVVVDATAGPFAVTAPNTNVTVTGGSSQTITWNVSGTTAAPVSAANVKISLSTDGGQTFPTVLNASTANDGTESVTVPNVATTSARIKVEAVGNIFFDISDANFTIVPGTPTTRRFIDFDGDAKTDISIFRPSVGEWWYLRSSNGGNAALQFGSSTDTRAAADYTGDGKTDIAFWRPSTGEWFVLRSENSTFLSFPFGSSGDIPSPADFDGDGKADPTVFRPATATWFISRSSDNGTTITNFGISTDRPIPADYDGDGKDDIAIYRPAVSEWWILRSTAGLVAAQFGASGDRTVQGDYSGDGKADIAVYRPSTGLWLILRSEDGSFFSLPFGTAGDIPSPGDYDGDGKYDTAVFRPSTGTWFIQQTTAGTLITGFGTNGDLPVPNSYVR